MKQSGLIAIVGAGAIGCYLGVQLHKAGRKLVLIGSRRVADSVNNGGLSFEYPDDHTESYAPGELEITSEYTACRSASLVIVAVKSTITEQVIQQLLPVIGAQTTVLTVQNGVSNGARFRDAFKSHVVIEGMTTANVVELASSPAGTVFRLSRTGEIYVSETYRGSLSALENVAGLRIEAVADITGVLWSKLLLNLANPLNALSGLPLRENLYDREFRLLWCACMREAMQVVQAAGISLRKVSPLPTRYLPVMLSLPNVLFLRLARRMTDMDAQAKTSMAQDLERGRPTENDYLSREVVDLGKRCSVPTPLNEAVYTAIAEVEASSGSAVPADLYRKLCAMV